MARKYLDRITPDQAADRNMPYTGTGSRRYPCTVRNCNPYVLVTVHRGRATHADLHHRLCGLGIIPLHPTNW